MILSASARRRVDAIEPPPYTLPTAAPWNAPTYLTTPTYDGSGSSVHPDVIDMWAMHGLRAWSGYRYWMAHTPYPNSNDDFENPSILCSHNGWEWQVPPGGTNPIYPRPAIRWNSDTDLTYDPETAELALIYRDEDFVPQVARSSDGVTWPETATPVTRTNTLGEQLSPAVVRNPAGGWIMWTVAYSGRQVYRWDAATIEGPWTVTAADTGIPTTAWHLDVCHHAGQYWALISDGSEPSSLTLWAASSTDGIAWARGDTPLMTAGDVTGSWDGVELYRGTLQPHEDGQSMRVWYPGRGPSQSWRIGLTQIPLTEWPTPPPT